MPLYHEIEAARERFERALIPLVADLFGAQGDRIIEAVRSAPGPEWAMMVAEAEADDPDLAREALALVWGTVVPPFASATYEALEPSQKALTNGTKQVDDDVWLQNAVGFIEAEGGVMVASITDTLLKELRDVLQEGIDEGWGTSKLVAELRKSWPELTAIRAERIVRTEVMSAQNYATQLGAERAAEDFGLELEKEWLETPDDRTRDSHVEAGGQRVPLNETFTVGGHSARWPGDPNLPAKERVQCRCTTVAVPVEQKAVNGLSRTDQRNAAIRAAYPSLKEKHGHQVAYDLLAEEYHLSPYTVKDIIYSE